MEFSRAPVDSSRIFAAMLLLVVLLVVTGCDSGQGSAQLPTPGPGRSPFTSSQFHYKITYPTDWKLDASADQSVVRVLILVQKQATNVVALDVHCLANPGTLDAQSWWHQHQPQYGLESAVGPTTLASKTPAFVATGRSQDAYTVYTVTLKQIACQMYAIQLDSATTKVAVASVNTFAWLPD
jgi:hypothetical protein